MYFLFFLSLLFSIIFKIICNCDLFLFFIDNFKDFFNLFAFSKFNGYFPDPDSGGLISIISDVWELELNQNIVIPVNDGSEIGLNANIIINNNNNSQDISINLQFNSDNDNDNDIINLINIDHIEIIRNIIVLHNIVITFLNELNVSIQDIQPYINFATLNYSTLSDRFLINSYDVILGNSEDGLAIYNIIRNGLLYSASFTERDNSLLLISIILEGIRLDAINNLSDILPIILDYMNSSNFIFILIS